MKAKLVRESLNEISEIPESDKELIAQAREIEPNYIDWSLVSDLEDKAVSQEAKDILHSISTHMYHKEEASSRNL